MEYLTLSESNIEAEHICCAFSDKKCRNGYQAKKEWLATEIESGYVFKRINERAKVFIEYGEAEKSWLPIHAPNYIALGCFWVSGKYKKKGHGKALLESAIVDAKLQGKKGLVAVVGQKKKHFMSDGKWLKKQGFDLCDEAPNGFELLHLPFGGVTDTPVFLDHVKRPETEDVGCVVYYSNRCPFSEYHVTESLVESCAKRNIPLKIVKLSTREQAQECSSPATIFSLFLNGEFVTTDISACMDSRFDKTIGIQNFA